MGKKKKSEESPDLEEIQEQMYFETVIHYYEPVYQVIDVPAFSAEEATDKVHLEIQGSLDKVRDFRIVSMTPITRKNVEYKIN